MPVHTEWWFYRMENNPPSLNLRQILDFFLCVFKQNTRIVLLNWQNNVNKSKHGGLVVTEWRKVERGFENNVRKNARQSKHLLK